MHSEIFTGRTSILFVSQRDYAPTEILVDNPEDAIARFFAEYSCPASNDVCQPLSSILFLEKDQQQTKGQGQSGYLIAKKRISPRQYKYMRKSKLDFIVPLVHGAIITFAGNIHRGWHWK